MRFISRIAAAAVVGATAVALTTAPSSAAARPSSAGADVVYGFSPSSAAASSTTAAARWGGSVETYEHKDYTGEQVGAVGEVYNLATVQGGPPGSMNDKISSLKNYSNVDVCFYADAGYSGRSLWLRSGSVISNLGAGNWIDNQISSIRSAVGYQKCF